MNLPRFSVHHPVFTIMASLIVIIVGAISLYRLSIDLMPDITYPTISISTDYENASPVEIEELVTRLIEEAMSAVPGVVEVNSVSQEGESNVRVTFAWGTNLDEAANDIRDRLDRIINRLPDDAERPRLRKFDLASFPVLILGAASALDPIQARNIIDNQVKYRIERIPGVASLDIRGGLDREIHVYIKPEKIKALGLPLDRILARIKEENINLPAGTIEQGRLDVTIRTPGIYTDLDELRRTVIATREGVPIQLGEVADVEDSWEKITRIVRINGQPGIRMSVSKQSGTNTVEVANAVLQELERINRDIPQVKISAIIDTSDYIKRSITNVSTTIFYGGFLALLVLLIFLRSIPSTAIIATTIPISIIATFALMYFGGFTLNLMTLGGLALGIGMLVDNAIVVLENIHRLRESGAPAEQSAVDGSQEVMAAVIASTLTTLVVFLPLIFVRGMTGVMFKQLSYVVAFSLSCSLAVALTLVPMLASKIRPTENNKSADNLTLSRRLFRITGRFFKRLEDEYAGLLHFSINHKKTVIAGALLLLLGSLTLIPVVGVEFMPSTDQGEVRISGEMAAGTNLQVLSNAFAGLEKIIREEAPEIKNMETFIGGSSWRSRNNTGSIRISLKPRSERSRSSEDIANALRRKLRDIPGMKIRTRASEGLSIVRMGSADAEKVQIDIRGYDLEVADNLASHVLPVVESVAGITDGRISRESGTPEELIIVDRQKAADMQLTVAKIADMLKTVLSGASAGYFRDKGKEYKILVKLKDAEKRSLNDILNLPLSNASGQPVILRNVVHVRPRTGPVLIERKDQERIVMVQANTSGRDMGSILKDLQQRIRSIPVPGDFSLVFGGDYEEQQESFRELLLGLILSIILIYMVMASLFESLKDPFIVIFAVPMGAIGVILMLLITNTTFNVQSYIGCIMLGGIAVNNAILLVDHTNLLRRRDGMALQEAIEEAGRRRLRPILMTSFTTILAMLPLALGAGEGGEAQAPMARALIGGLMSSNIITLVFIPTFYAIVNRPKKAADRG